VIAADVIAGSSKQLTDAVASTAFSDVAVRPD